MKTVGIKELKARLSEYLRAVKRGEVVVVTERDEVIAEITPPRLDRNRSEDVRHALAALAAAGEITLAPKRPKGWRWRAKGLGLPRGTAAAIMKELRAESRDE